MINFMGVFMNEFLILCLLNFIIILQSNFIIFYAGHLILNVDFKGRAFIKEFIIFSIILTISLSAISFISLSNETYISIPIDFVMEIVQIVLYIIFIKRHCKRFGWSSPLLLISISISLERFILYLSFYFRDYINSIINLGNLWLDQLVIYTLVNMLTILLLFILSKVSIVKNIRILFDFPKLAYCFGGIFLLIHIIANTFGLLFYEDSPIIIPIFSGLSLFIIVVISTVAREVDRNYKLNYSEQLIKQQGQYVEHIESLYSDLRKIQHDYKNLLSGMYLQVLEGDIYGIKEYLSRNLLSTDEALQQNIKQQNQLTNIKIVAVKSLLFTKIMIAKPYNIFLNIEVINPVISIPMEINDFLRVLGISIDNAIEASSKLRRKRTVDILFIQTNDYIEIIIKNSFEGIIDKEKIWEIGYSTKGKNRGLGLSNYKNILDSYPNILLETKISNNIFSHKILIPV